MNTHHPLELMSPAGSYESLHAAINAGADAIYFGVEQLNMRARSSKTFTLDDLEKIAAITADKGINSYLALNTIVYDGEIELMQLICNAAKKKDAIALDPTTGRTSRIFRCSRVSF